uniref:Ig-like domain-containing protein n=1 Tax=Sinocyclocheilus grahami TaxID=75366 RepID=A0A672RJ54_SINGR
MCVTTERHSHSHVSYLPASGSGCPVLECWFVQEKPGHGGAFSEESRSELHPPADISPSRIYSVTALVCTLSRQQPSGRSDCEMNPFMPHASMVRWASALTDSAHSPVYLQADWFSVAAQGIDEQLTLSSIMRAPSASKEPVSSKTPVVRSRLGEAVLLDCGFWVDSSSPVHGSGFSVEWRYQFRGEGRLVLAYDGKTDRFAETSETRADIDITEAQVRHSETYICTVYLPHLLAPVAVDLEIVEPPSLSIYPSPLPLLVPGQVLLVQCEASGFAPHTLDLSWEFSGADGTSRSLGQGSVTGHREASDGTFSQSSRLDGDVALVLYGMIKFLSWTFSSSGKSIQFDHYNL